MAAQVCPFHGDEFSAGRRLSDGSVAHECLRVTGHPGPGAWRWLRPVATPSARAGGAAAGGGASTGQRGLTEELGLADVLPATLDVLRAEHGDRWFEYGLVERAYAAHQPEGWDQLVRRWGHTTLEQKPYTASVWLASALARLSGAGAVAYHGGRGTGRWSYDSDISWWASVPPPDWGTSRRSWVEVLHDDGAVPRSPQDLCQTYVTARS